MPGFGEDPSFDLDRLDQGAPNLAIDTAESYARSFGQLADLRPTLSYVQDYGRRLSDAASTAPALPFGSPVSPERAAARGTPLVTPPKIDAADANERYGVDGYLRFNQPTWEDEAAFQSAQAQARRFGDQVAADSNPNPLLSFGASLAGALVNPANIGLMVLTDGLAEGAVGATGLRDAGAAMTGLGRVANRAASVVGEGALAQVPFVGANALTANYMGEDYGAGDALRDIAAGAILHTTVHAALRGASALAGRLDAAGGGPDVAPSLGAPDAEAASSPSASAFTPNPTPAEGVPPEVDALSPDARRGAFAMALDQMTGDRSVDVGDLVARELEPESLAYLNERSAEPTVPSFRPLDDATAVTTRGTEIPVRYGLAELGDLTTSHDDNLSVNPAYPAQLQPRERSRAGAQARNYQLETELNPKLLMGDVGAGAGAPIVGPDGVVESGNGRTIALRRSAVKGGEAYGRYRAALEAAGFDTAGMRAPALVRMRSEPMTGAQRSALAREMNVDVTERMGATEQAMADAARIPDQAFDAIGPNEGPATSRDFARDFITRVAPEQANVLAQADGTLSPEGARRIKAAVLARAYGDAPLVGQIFEGEETPARKLGEALADAAPAWAKIRAAAAAGEIPAELDLTEPLRSALELVRFAAREKLDLGEILAERLGQGDMFAGDAVSPFTEAFLRLFYRDADFKTLTPKDKLAAALRDYARQALEVKPGPDLFGDTADADTARAILKIAADKFQRGDPGNLDVRPPGKAIGNDQAARTPVIDLREPGGERAGGAEGVPPGGEPGAGGEGEGSGRPSAEQLIAADPELKALAEDTDALLEREGLDLETPDKLKPETLAEAIRAAAVCMAEEGFPL